MRNYYKELFFILLNKRYLKMVYTLIILGPICTIGLYVTPLQLTNSYLSSTTQIKEINIVSSFKCDRAKKKLKDEDVKPSESGKEDEDTNLDKENEDNQLNDSKTSGNEINRGSNLNSSDVLNTDMVDNVNKLDLDSPKTSQECILESTNDKKVQNGIKQ